MKFILSLVMILSSIMFFESQALPFRLRGCPLTNSSQCKNPDRFKYQLNKGCGSPSSNCRLKFCKANCIDISSPDEEETITEQKVLHLCKKNCLDNAVLVRLDSSSRAALYDNFLPSQGRSGKRARKYAKFASLKEEEILQKKGKQWWRFGRKPKLALYKKLKAEYERLIQEKVKKLEAAKARGDDQATAKITQDVTQLVAEAAETLAPVPQSVVEPSTSQEDSGNNRSSIPTRPSELSPQERALAKKAYAQWWKTVQGRKEAAKLAQERADVAQSLVVSTGAPAEIADKAADMAGEWREGSDGTKYFVPAPPPLPGQSMAAQKSPVIKKLSSELNSSGDEGIEMEEDSPSFTPPPPPPLPPQLSSGLNRPRSLQKPLIAPKPARLSAPPSRPVSSTSFDEETKGEEGGPSFTPPPPPPLPQPSASASSKERQALLADLQSDTPLARLKKRSSSVDSARSSTSDDARGALLADIQRGRQLKKVETNDRSGAFSKSSTSSPSRTGIAAGIDKILARRAAIAGNDDDDDDKNTSDDEEWES